MCVCARACACVRVCVRVSLEELREDDSPGEELWHVPEEVRLVSGPSLGPSLGSSRILSGHLGPSRAISNHRASRAISCHLVPSRAISRHLAPAGGRAADPPTSRVTPACGGDRRECTRLGRGCRGLAEDWPRLGRDDPSTGLQMARDRPERTREVDPRYGPEIESRWTRD